MADHTDSNLRVPQKKSMTIQAVNDIMNAYNSQSKIQLYGDESAYSGSGLDGVKGHDIPLSALRPNAANSYVDENGRMRRRTPGDVLKESKDISNAYRKMKGMKPLEDDAPVQPAGRRVKDLSGIELVEGDYVEDMPDTDEGLLDVLAIVIKNAKANLEMLQSLYAILSGDEDPNGDKEEISNDDDDIYDDGELPPEEDGGEEA